MSELVCVIPALDAAATLPQVLDAVRDSLPDVAIVGIDDGSHDDTGNVLRAGCDVADSFRHNRGKGAALRAGFAHALRIGARVVVTLDADGQHDPRYAPKLVAALDEADIAIGERTRTGTAMPLRRRVSNALSTAAISAVAGRRLPDTQCGFRAMRREVIERVTAVGDRYEFETDFIIRAARKGFSIVAVPIPTIYGSASHFRECRDALRVVATIWRHRASASA
ncbi:MAG TPA: glycosyltransferase family 2 protein [Gemmatimonadaceae bacterium]|nr:glycosyltransferase family 2 protein [Gemmatimonadaceae bacterium]